MADNSQLLSRAEAYADSKGIRLIGKNMLGYGSDGSVWHSSRRTAVKALYHQKNFDNELECYLRLKAASVRRIGMFDVPFLEDFDNERRILEISIVQPPYLLDFGKVYLVSCADASLRRTNDGQRSRGVARTIWRPLEQSLACHEALGAARHLRLRPPARQRMLRRRG